MFELKDEELIGVWAALIAMVDDIHTPQDNLTEEEWNIAERLSERLTTYMNYKNIE